MQDFRTIDAWRKAHELVLNLHQRTKAFGKDEIFGITMLLRRSSITVTTRIAEAYGHQTSAEIAVGLRKAIATTNELEYLILLAKDLGHWNEKVAEELSSATIEVRKMTYGLIRKL